jgi:hypothetical protein
MKPDFAPSSLAKLSSKPSQQCFESYDALLMLQQKKKDFKKKIINQVN